MKKNTSRFAIVFALALLLLVVVSLFVGAYHFEQGIFTTLKNLIINPSTVPESEKYILLQLRAPRIVMGILIGCALAISGTSLQGMFKNALASPDLIGITSGAMLFAAITIVLGAGIKTLLPDFLHYMFLSLMAFVGAMLSMLLVYKMATTNGKTNVVVLLLAGVAISALTGAATGVLTYLSTEEELRNLTFWTLGSLSGANWTKNGILFLCVVVGSLVLIQKGKALNALSLGEKEAAHLGIEVEKTKKQIVLFSGIMVGTCVAFSGSIGFVGLIVPYILRLSFQSNYVKILPLSILLGAIILVLADTLSRTIVQPAELPIGILTALMGTPVFIAILIRYKKSL